MAGPTKRPSSNAPPSDSIEPGAIVTIQSALKPWPATGADMDPETTPLMVFPDSARLLDTIQALAALETGDADEEPTL